MKFKILAALFVFALSFIVLQASAQVHQHHPTQGGFVVMFGNSDHVEISKVEDGLIFHLSDSTRKPLNVSDFEFVKAVLVKGSKEIELESKEKAVSALSFELPPGDLSKAGLKVILKRKKGDTFTQALPMSKLPKET